MSTTSRYWRSPRKRHPQHPRRAAITAVIAARLCFSHRCCTSLDLVSVHLSLSLLSLDLSTQGAAFVSMAAKVPFAKRWIKPEIYPLFLAIGAALGICGFAMARNLAINPDVRIVKEDRAAGVLENFKEGEAYKMHGFRSFLKHQEPQIMPGFNKYFSNPK